MYKSFLVNEFNDRDMIQSMTRNILLLTFLFILTAENVFSMPMIIAHRGAEKIAPENTVSSYKKAIEKGAQILETDVQMSSDGKLFLMHDYTLNRTTTGKGNARDYTFKQLKELDAGSWFSENYKNERIPGLEEVLSLIQGTSLRFILEVKWTSNDEGLLEKKLGELVKKMKLEKQVYFESFDPNVLERLRKTNPTVEQIYLANAYIPFLELFISPHPYWKELSDTNYELVELNKSFYWKSIYDRIRVAGKKLFLWGVDSKEMISRLTSDGVEGIEPTDLDLFKKD